MAIEQHDANFYKKLLDYFPGTTAPVADSRPIHERLGIRNPVEEFFDMESGSMQTRENFASRDDMLRYREAQQYGDTLASLYEQRVPEDLRNFFSGVNRNNPVPGLQYDESQRAYAFDPLTGQYQPMSSIFGEAHETDPGQDEWLVPEYLAARYGIHAPARYYRDLFGDDLGIGEFAPAAIGFMVAPGLTQAFGGGMLGSIGAGATIGGISGAATGGDPIRGALMGGIGGGIGSGLTELGVPKWLANAAGGLGTGMLSGMDLKNALKSAALGAGIGIAAENFAPVINDIVEVGQSAYSVDDLYADTSVDADLKRRGIQVADANGGFEVLFSPNSYVNQPGFLGAGSEAAALESTISPVPGDLAEGVTYMPGTFSGYDPVTGQAMFNRLPPELQQEDERNRDALEAGDNPPPEPTVTSKDLERYAKIAKQLYEMLGGQEQALRGAPQRPAGEMAPEDEQAYLDQVVQYLGLDPATMAEAGLTPGTPEYLEYILQQAEAIIGQVLGDANPDGEDFGALLRAKTAEELQALNRAIYVRGQLGSLVGPGQYADPLTGVLEDVAAPAGSARFLPGVAAWQRGLARSAEELAGMRGQEAKRFLGGMLERNPDIYRMQARRDAQALREALESQGMDDLKRRRRGMFGDEAFFQQELEAMNTIDLDRMLALLMGRDAGRQGAAVEELFDWNAV